MRVFLASIPLDETKVVVVGAGEPALAKLRLFLNSPADLVWFTPDGAPALLETPAGAPTPIMRTPDADDLTGARLVFIALHDVALARRIAEAARQLGAQANIVDQPGFSDFHTPALIDRDEVVVAVATGGNAPILGRDLRSRIEAVLPQGVASVARLAGELRGAVKESIPDFLDRRRFWERAFRSPPPTSPPTAAWPRPAARWFACSTSPQRRVVRPPQASSTSSALGLATPSC